MSYSPDEEKQKFIDQVMVIFTQGDEIAQARLSASGQTWFGEVKKTFENDPEAYDAVCRAEKLCQPPNHKDLNFTKK